MRQVRHAYNDVRGGKAHPPSLCVFRAVVYPVYFCQGDMWIKMTEAGEDGLLGVDV